MASIRGGSTYGFAAEDDAGLGGSLQEADLENIRNLGPRWQFVSGRAGRRQRPCESQHQLFQGQPADALNESAFDLPTIDDRGNRIADVFEDVSSQETIVAGEGVYFNLRHCCAVGEVVKRRARPAFDRVNSGRAVVAMGEERNAMPIGRVGNARERDGPMFLATGKTKPWENWMAASRIRATRRQPPPSGCEFGQASATAAPFKSVPADAAVADVFGILSVRVGMTRTIPRSKPKLSAAICWILVCSPCPISVPP